jgi:hypothetical protein
MADHKIKIVEEESQKEFTKEEIIRMMVVCKTQNRLADMLGVHTNTITNLVKSDSTFCDAVKAGKREASKEVVNALFDKATKDKDIGAIKYVLNNLDPEEWAEKSKVENKIEVSAMSEILDEIEKVNGQTPT